MSKVQRTRGIRRVIRTRVLNIPLRKHVIAGSESCGRLMVETRQRCIPGPSDSAILAWARFDLNREILGGYWQQAA